MFGSASIARWGGKPSYNWNGHKLDKPGGSWATPMFNYLSYMDNSQLHMVRNYDALKGSKRYRIFNQPSMRWQWRVQEK